MGILSKVSDFVGGALFKEIKNTVMAYVPPKLTAVEKQELEIKISKYLLSKELQISRELGKASEQLDKRIAEQEGTASDLKSIPILGPIMLFLRGCQRPLWGFFTMYMDYEWLLGAKSFSEQQNTAMIVINILVLGFLFGERTIKNLEPLIIRVFSKQS